MNSEQRLERLKEQLKLTADQVEKITELDKKNAEKMSAEPTRTREQMQQMTDAQRTAMRERFQQIRDEYNEGMKAILTAEQWKTYEEMNKDRGKVRVRVRVRVSRDSAKVRARVKDSDNVEDGTF